MTNQEDTGKHYRYEYKGIKLDPARICDIYGVDRLMMATIIKKALCAGNRGHKDKRRDLLDIINAANRELEMMGEDEIIEVVPEEPELNWIKNTGVKPDCNQVNMKLKDGMEFQSEPSRFIWDSSHINPIIEYQILE